MISDMAGNEVVAIRRSNALQVSTVTADRSAPSLTCFDLDLDSNTLTLSFSESVRVSTLNISQVSLWSQRFAGVSVSLTGGYTNSTNGPSVKVFLTDADVNKVKFEPSLATIQNNTYLSLSSSLIKDMYGNDVTAIPTASAKLVCTYTPDSSPPRLVSFDLKNDEWPPAFDRCPSLR